MIDPQQFSVGMVHEWFVNHAGSEKVVENLLHVYPAAELHALVDFLPPAERAFIQHKPVRTSFVQRLPGANPRFRNYLPVFPVAIEQFDLRAFDVVISSSHVVAKGALTHAEQLHVCYCHSPVRYAWDLHAQYLQEAGLRRGPKGMAARWVLHRLRNWDALSANRPDHYVANSRYIARRIRKVYNREATVIYPPVQTEAFPLRADKEDFYLTAARMVPYKRVDLVVEAFAHLPDRRLVVVGDGPELRKVKAKAGRNVEIIDHQPFDQLVDLMQRARAFVFAAEEDFGITVVEAQACGTPVVAFGRGGATETVRDGQTGVLFGAQEPRALADAVRRFERTEEGLNPSDIRAHALQFDAARFQENIRTFVREKIDQFNALRR